MDDFSTDVLSGVVELPNEAKAEIGKAMAIGKAGYRLGKRADFLGTMWVGCLMFDSMENVVRGQLEHCKARDLYGKYTISCKRGQPQGSIVVRVEQGDYEICQELSEWFNQFKKKTWKENGEDG